MVTRIDIRNRAMARPGRLKLALLDPNETGIDTAEANARQADLQAAQTALQAILNGQPTELHLIATQDDEPYDGFEGLPWNRNVITALTSAWPFTIPTTAWTTTTREGYEYEATLSVPGALEGDFVEINFNESSVSIASEAGLATVMDTVGENSVVLLSEYVPQGNLSGTYILSRRAD